MNNYFKYIPLFFFLLLVQFVLMNNFIVFNYGFCFIYIAFILLLPVEMPAILLILVSFLMGITVDIYSNTLGMNAAASVFTAFIRPYILKLVTPKGGYDMNFRFSIYKLGVVWFLTYSFPLIFIHLFLLFALDASDLSMIFTVLARALVSTLITGLVLIIGAYLIQSSKGK